MKRSKLHTIVISAFTLLCATSLHADSFTLLIYESKADLAARTDPQKASVYWGAYGDYAKKLTDAGILRGGYFIIDVPDQATALEWAKKAPALSSRAIEVKRHFPNPTMQSK